MKAPAIRDAQPAEMAEFYIDDWLFVGTIPLKAGFLAGQHVHEYDHPTFVAHGTIRVWVNDEDRGEVTAPGHVTIKAGERHKFLAVTDAVILCIHNLRGEGYPAIREKVEA